MYFGRGLGLKKFSKIILVLLLVNVITFNFAFADNVTDVDVTENQTVSETTTEAEEMNKSSESNVPFEVEETKLNTDKAEEVIDTVKEKSESIMYKIIKAAGDISLPICFLLVLWGSVLYFILGIRNLYKKRQGLLLMWGALTFLVIAKVMVLVGWFIFEYKA